MTRTTAGTPTPVRAVALAAALLVTAVACSSSSGGGATGPDASSTAASSAPATTASRPASGSGSASGSASAGAGSDRVLRPSVAGVVATGLKAPWGLTFLPDGSTLVSERDDDLIVHVATSGKVTPVGRVEGVRGDGEGGLLGIALSPTYASDKRLYAYFTRNDNNVLAR